MLTKIAWPLVRQARFYLSRFARYVETVSHRSHPSAPVIKTDYGLEYPTVSHPERVSDWERHFYRALYTAGIRPIPQYTVEKYDLDFAVIQGDRRLNIEIDGERYHRKLGR